MKVKTLRFKESKEFVHIMEGGQIATSSIPDILADTASIKTLTAYFETGFPKQKIDYDKLEVVEFDLIEAGEVGADIRNKLSPPNNLIELLEDYFSDDPQMEKDVVKKFIIKEMEQTKISVAYLSTLL